MRRGDCWSIVATIDSASRYHVAANCGKAISYVTSTDGVSWSETVLKPPAHRIERDPQLAVDGDTLYVAYSRLAPTDGGCGDDGLRDVGVYTRTRHLPDGNWSAPERVGRVGDTLVGLRAAGGVLHLAVTAGDGGPMFYEAQSSGGLTRIRIPDVRGAASLRVGDDGHARIVYSVGQAIRYARVNGRRLSIRTIAASKTTDMLGPSLVLGAGDRAYVMWTQVNLPSDGGCAEPEIPPGDIGTYLGTDASGSWTASRMTRSIAPSAFTIDPSTGSVHAVLDGKRMTYFTSPTGQKWTRERIPGTEDLHVLAVRIDPGSGAIVVFATDWNGKDRGIYMVSKR